MNAPKSHRIITVLTHAEAVSIRGWISQLRLSEIPSNEVCAGLHKLYRNLEQELFEDPPEDT